MPLEPEKKKSFYLYHTSPTQSYSTIARMLPEALLHPAGLVLSPTVSAYDTPTPESSCTAVWHAAVKIDVYP